MGCGCISQHQVALSAVGGPRLFLHRPTDGEFVQSLGADEQKDKKLLLAYFHHLHEGQFQLTPQFLDLVRRKGVPPRYRWSVWRAITGWNALSKPGAYERIAQRRADPKTVDAIEKDLDRTFPGIVEFGDERKRQLASILQAFSCLFPKVGYCQGMNFVAGFILLSSTAAPDSSPEDAFFMLVQVMAKYRASLLFCDGLPLLKLYTFQFCIMLEKLFPEVHRHFVRENVTPELYVTKWFLTVFTQPLPFAVATRLWDLIVCDGLQALVHLALASVKLLRRRLVRQSTEGVLELLSLRGPDSGLPSGGSLVRAALALRVGSPCGPGIEAKLSKLKSAWVRQCPEDALELERAGRELCGESMAASGAFPLEALPASVALPAGTAVPEAGAGLRGRSRTLSGGRRSAAGADGACSSPLLLGAAEAALAAAAEEASAVDEASSSDESSEDADLPRFSEERTLAQHPAAPKAPGSSGRGFGQTLNSGAAVAAAAVAMSVVNASANTPGDSPHIIAAEAKVEVNKSMPSRRPARMYRADSDPTNPGGSRARPSASVGSSQDASGSERVPVMQHLPRLSAIGATSTQAAGRRRGLLSTGADGEASGDEGGGGSSSSAHRAPAAGRPCRGSPPARPPDVGGLPAKESIQGRSYSRLMSPLREDDLSPAADPSPASRGTPRLGLPSVALFSKTTADTTTPSADSVTPVSLAATWPENPLREEEDEHPAPRAQDRVGPAKRWRDSFSASFVPASARSPLQRQRSRGSSTERESDPDDIEALSLDGHLATEARPAAKVVPGIAARCLAGAQVGRRRGQGPASPTAREPAGGAAGRQASVGPEEPMDAVESPQAPKRDGDSASSDSVSPMGPCGSSGFAREAWGAAAGASAGAVDGRPDRFLGSRANGFSSASGGDDSPRKLLQNSSAPTLPTGTANLESLPAFATAKPPATPPPRAQVPRRRQAKRDGGGTPRAPGQPQLPHIGRAAPVARCP